MPSGRTLENFILPVSSLYLYLLREPCGVSMITCCCSGFLLPVFCCLFFMLVPLKRPAGPSSSAPVLSSWPSCRFASAVCLPVQSTCFVVAVRWPARSRTCVLRFVQFDGSRRSSCSPTKPSSQWHRVQSSHAILLSGP